MRWKSMSSFIDKLRQSSQQAARPMGFKAAQTISRPRLMLIVRLGQSKIDALDELVAGADAGLLPVTGISGVTRLKEVVKSVPGFPFGAWLEATGRGGIKHLDRAGADFVIFPAETTPLSQPSTEKMGRIIAITPPEEGWLIPAINDLPLDAVLINSQPRFGGTWHQLMLVRRVADLISKPILVPISGDTSREALQLLWESGVDVVVVDSTKEKRGELRELLRIINSLITPSKSRRGNARALVPSVPAEFSPVTGDEEE
jgi:hypothetical protein